MLFNSNKKKALETAQMIEHAFRLRFASTQYVSLNGDFIPPKGFYFDKYILGYTVTFAQLFMKHIHKMGNMAPEKKAQYTMDVISGLNIKPSEVRSLQEYILSDWHILQTTEDYTRGTDAAIAIFGLTYGLTSPTNPEPLIRESYEAASTFVELGLAPDQKSAQIMALISGTLGQHIRDTYLLSGNFPHS